MRTMARTHEIAIRAALGASRRRLVQHSLIESLCISLAGAIGGVPLAWAGVARALEPRALGRYSACRPGARGWSRARTQRRHGPRLRRARWCCAGDLRLTPISAGDARSGRPCVRTPSRARGDDGGIDSVRVDPVDGRGTSRSELLTAGRRSTRLRPRGRRRHAHRSGRRDQSLARCRSCFSRSHALRARESSTNRRGGGGRSLLGGCESRLRRLGSGRWTHRSGAQRRLVVDQPGLFYRASNTTHCGPHIYCRRR